MLNLAVVFGIFALARSLSVLQNPRAGRDRQPDPPDERANSAAVLDTFLAKRSISLADIRNRLTVNTPWIDLFYLVRPGRVLTKKSDNHLLVKILVKTALAAVAGLGG